MRLPAMAYDIGMTATSQTAFGGLDHTPGAGDGAVYQMKNLTGADYPLLASRPPRWKVATLTQPGGLFARGALCWVAQGGFWYQGERKGDVSEGEKIFAALGSYLLIFPDKVYYNTQTGVFGSLESKWTGAGLSFQNGTLYGQEAQANTIQAQGVTWTDYFQKGDAVTISGCTTHAENNKSLIIRDIQDDKLVFYEYSFTLDGEKGDEAYTEEGEVTLTRTVPDLDYVCENENRVWGCKDNTIYCSKLGDPFNWNVFDGLATDAYAVDTGSAGNFTGCISYLGYPVFFKEDHIYKVYGTMPSNFQVMGTETLGVMEGCGKSLAAAGEVLFYLSRGGVMAYSGSVPQCISRTLGDLAVGNAVAGADGLRYYLSAQGAGEGWSLLVYDTQTKLWHREDEPSRRKRWSGRRNLPTSPTEARTKRGCSVSISAWRWRKGGRSRPGCRWTVTGPGCPWASPSAPPPSAASSCPWCPDGGTTTDSASPAPGGAASTASPESGTAAEGTTPPRAVPNGGREHGIHLHRLFEKGGGQQHAQGL